MSRENEMLIQVIERYIYHKGYISDNPLLTKVARKMCDIDLWEMWELTQNNR